MNNPMSRTEQLRAIKIGRGVQYILDEAYKILGNPILTHDMDYKVIAKTEMPVADDPIWNEFEETGMVGRERLIFYRDECFFESAANASNVTFLFSEKLKYNRIYGKIFTKDSIQVGCACMVECNVPFEDDSSENFEVLCGILNEELSNSGLFQTYGQAFREILISRLIKGNFEDRDLYVAHLESLYLGTKNNLHLAVADLSKCDPAHTKLAYYRDLLMKTQPDFEYAVYLGYIVIILSTDDTAIDVKKDLSKLNRLFVRQDIYAGISGCFENLFELPKFYAQAVKALKKGLKSSETQRFFFYDEIEQKQAK